MAGPWKCVLRPPGLGGKAPRSYCELCLYEAKRTLLGRAGCVQDMARSLFRVAVIVPGLCSE